MSMSSSLNEYTFNVVGVHPSINQSNQINQSYPHCPSRTFDNGGDENGRANNGDDEIAAPAVWWCVVVVVVVEQDDDDDDDDEAAQSKTRALDEECDGWRRR